MKRVIAATLAVLMLVTAVPMDAMAAQADETDNAVVEEVTETEETTEKEDTAAQEVTEDETVSAEENDNVEEATEIVTPQTDIDIEFLYVDVPEIQGGEAERILLGVTDTSVVSSIVLRVRNLTTGNVFAYTHTDKTDKSFLFEFVPQESGEYLVEGVSYVVNDVSTDYSFADNGMESKFGVDVQVTTQPDAIVEDAEDVAAEVVVTDQNGTTISDKSISEVLEETSVQVQKNRAAASKDVVVVLDPGHGGNDGGAQGNGLSEKNLNLAIAQYCKAELETYSGVKVYMTRTDDTFVGLEDRVALARNWGATIFVSIHVNSSANASANGAEVWYPNPTGDPNIHASGAALAQNIENQLVALGLANRGIHYRNYSYDWSVDENLGDADYYSVIRNAKASGIPGVIVEHAFISNGSDAANYLGNSAALQKLGIADATGIAQYFGLTKESYVKMKSAAAIDATGIKLTWNKYPNADGYYVYRESATETKSYIGRTTSLSYIDRTGTYGTKYKYTIQAYQNQDGQRVRISKLTDDGLEAKGGDFIVAIQAVSNDIFNTNKISWTKASGVVGYYVFRKESSGAKWTKIGETSETSFIDEKAQCGKQYLYTVRAYWKNGDATVYSNYNRQGIAVKTATGKVVNIKTVKCSFNMNKIVWSSMEGVTGYKVLRKDGQNKWTTIGTTSGTSFVDYTGQCGKTYAYTVRAYRKSGDSIYYGQYDSTGASITTNTGVTTGIKATASTYNYNKITWDSLK
ncbi:MAG: N-acetylmuramoyl-L-alanine amidase, partial [Lachnospiraceae bacterium]|nr:N-acetylmuramoyl-L-alanine amidase [Lachnospiraceae bacterium]